LKVTILNKEGDRRNFLVEGVDNAFINSLRRTIINDVPTMMVEDIFYFDNTGPVPDEVLAHRVGFVPLTTDLDNYTLPEHCDCNADLGCPKCRTILTMDVKADGEERTVYSGDLISIDPEVRPVSDKIPLSKLAPGQAIRFEAYAQLGRGKTHIKWSPVSQAKFNNLIELDVDEENAQTCLKQCPEGALHKEGRLKVIDIAAFNSCDACRIHYPKEQEKVKEAMRMDAFVFNLEGVGSLPPERIVTKAVNILTTKLDELRDKLERGEIHEEIIDFEIEEGEKRHLYTIGGEINEEEVDNATEDTALKEDEEY
jgi:DNA-directed RNA polymerase subunit D